jgi:WD40 repeat protein
MARLLIAVLFLLAGCAPLRQSPDVVIDTAHTGGNLVRVDSHDRWLISGGWEGQLAVWSLPAGELVRSWQAHQGTVNGILLSGENRVITAGFDGRLAEWTLEGALLRSQDAGSPVTAAAGAVDADLLVTGHQDGRVRIWGLSTFNLRDTFRPHEGPLHAVAVSRDGKRIASSGEDGTVSWLEPGGAPQRLESAPTDTWTLDFSPDGEILMGAGWFRLHRWELASGSLRTIPTEHHGVIRSVHYSRDGSFLATISRQTDSAVLLLDPESGATLRRFEKHPLCGGDIHLSPSERYLVTTAADASVRVYDLQRTP